MKNATSLLLVKGSPLGALNHSIQNSTVTRLAGTCSLWKPAPEGIAALRTTPEQQGRDTENRLSPWAKLGEGIAPRGFHPTSACEPLHGKEGKGKAMLANLANTFPYSIHPCYLIFCSVP